MESESLNLEEQQEQLVAEYLELRDDAEGDSKAKRKLSRFEKKLDALYWKRVGETLSERVSPDTDHLAFTDEERLLIDLGLLDAALIPGVPDGFVDSLLDEIKIPGPVNHFYLSEWLDDRYRRYRLAEEVSAANEAEPTVGEKLGETRKKAMARLKPLFSGLPGVSGDVSKMVVEGRLDEQILRINLRLLEHEDRKGFLYRRRLWGLRGQVMAKARARAGDQGTLKLFDVVDEVYAQDWRERYEIRRKGETVSKTDTVQLETSVSTDKAVEYLLSEIRFVKTLMPIGALAGGVMKNCAVLLENHPRVTKKDTAIGFDLAKECDRGFTVNPVILIAPFKGRGIFEWDRDSLVVSLSPVASAEDSVANAAGNYRMLIDSLQQDGDLKAAYEERFPDTNFQQAFQSDYRDWVCRIGHGEREAMDEAHRGFFQELVGPDCSEALAPPNLRNIGPQTREAIRKRLEKQITMVEPDSNLYLRLAVLYWQNGDLDEALNRMAEAARLDPGAGMILFSLGILLRAQGNHDRAAGVFQACAKRVPESLWAVYAMDAAEGKV